MDGNFFFVIGIALVAAAVIIALVGIRGADKFPPNRGVMVGLILLFVVGVATTMAFAVVKSTDEQDKRNAELAKEEQQAAAETGQPEAGGAAAATVSVSSPADGALIYQPDGLSANPGNLAIDYDNPSPVPHSIAVATSNGNVLGETQPSANSQETLNLSDLKPGKYVFYCTVPGHREAGMQGNLTVGAGQNNTQ